MHIRPKRGHPAAWRCLRAGAALGAVLLFSGCGLAAMPTLPPLVTALASSTRRPTRPVSSEMPAATATRPASIATAHTVAALAATSTAAPHEVDTPLPTPAGPTAMPSATLPACAPPASQIISISVPSTTYPHPVPATVYLPACYNQAAGPLPVIYLLHGGNSDDSQWPDLNVQAEADALIAGGAAPFLVVMPGGVYNTYGVGYDDFVLSDLLPDTEHLFNVSRQGAGRAIGGVSLGGYWALKLAFDHPDQFAAVEGNSPVISHGAPEDPLARARTADGLGQLRIWLDVGDLDALHDSTVFLAQILRGRGLPVTLSVNPGSHIRTYWRAHMGDYLGFYLAALEPGGR